MLTLTKNYMEIRKKRNNAQTRPFLFEWKVFVGEETL